MDRTALALRSSDSIHGRPQRKHANGRLGPCPQLCVSPASNCRRARAPSLRSPPSPLATSTLFSSLAVLGELAQQRVAPRDAALMQAAEQSVLSEMQRGGPATDAGATVLSEMQP
jgi:hypothetical protein